MRFTSPHRRDPHRRLREDVRRLGELLGETLREQCGAEVFDTVERVRRLAKSARAGRSADARALAELLGSLTVESARHVARAFGHFLALANIAEEHHRIRRRRAYRSDPKSLPQRGSPEESFRRLVEAGVAPRELVATLSRLDFGLVLTAHPTEAARRTVLQIHNRIADVLGVRDRPDLLDEERDELEHALRRDITSLWQTDEIRHERPSPIDEVRSGLAIVEQVLWDVLPRFLRELDRALEHATGERLPRGAIPIRFGSWMGGDRDGNPHVTGAVTREAVVLARWQAVELLLHDVDALRAELSMSRGSEELERRAGVAREPYRALLRDVHRRLESTRRALEAVLEGDPFVAEPGVERVSELRESLELCDRSLRACGAEIVAEGRLLDVLRRLDAFGLSLVRLDARDDSSRHAATIAAITRSLGLGDYETWNEPQRVGFLVDLLENDRRLEFGTAALDAESREVLDGFASLADLWPDALGAYVISMARDPSDVLAVEWLQRLAGARHPRPVVPLFETLEDLEQAGTTVDRLLSLPWYRRTIDERHGGRQEVMIGYSDSAKRAGLFAASWALHRAQEELLRVGRRHGVEVTFFHGRGGTVSRGGAPLHAAIRSLPAGSVRGAIRVTEQGEVIQAKFGLPDIALRTLELYVTATVEASLRPPEAEDVAWRRIVTRMAEASEREYRDVVEREGFVEYFEAATPVAELGRLNIGSRPARRKRGGGLAALRAIPWVFAWNQNRLILPGWLGVEAAIRVATSEAPALARVAAERWPFLATTLDRAAMVLAKAEPGIAARYDEALVPAELRDLGVELRRRCRRTARALLDLTGRSALLERNGVLRRSISVRNPYVDPLSLLQIELLRRIREEDDPRLAEVLLLTVSGIAAGMRNTG